MQLLKLMGNPTVLGASGVASPNLPDKAYLLIALLILDHKGRADRATMAGALWPDAEAGAARVSLRRLLWQIRAWEERCGLHLVDASGRFLDRSRDCLPTDLDAIVAPRLPGNAAEIADAASGPLLQFEKTFEDSLERWLDQRRGYVAGLVKSALLADFDPEGADAARTVHSLRQLLPHDDQICRAAIGYFNAKAGPRAAVAQYQSFATKLKHDLDAVPDIETTMMVRRLTEVRPHTVELESPGADGPGKLPRFMLAPPPMAGEGRWRKALAMSFIEDIVISLSGNRSFEVIAPRSARLGPSRVLDAVAEFKLDYIVETSFCSVDATLAFVLMNARSRKILWADRLSLAEAKAANSRSMAVRVLASTISSEIDAAAASDQVLGNPGPAYMDFLMGKYRLLKLDLAEIRRGRRDLRVASTRAPQFASAYSWLARSFFMEWTLLARQEKDLLELACASARQAIELSPLDGSGHRELGRALFFIGDHDRANSALEMAARCSPSDADVLADCADCLVHYSDIEGAASSIYRALELNPLAPDQYFWTAGAVEFFRGNYDRSVATLQRMANPDPAARLLAASAAMAGQADLSHAYRDRFLASYPDFDVGKWINTIPQRQREHRDLYAHALRLAGL